MNRITQEVFAGSGQKEVGFDYAEQDLVIASVSDFPSFDYSMRQVLRVGEALRGNLLWTDETAQSVLEVFTIANNWRDSHAYLMPNLRYELLGQMRRQKLQGITSAP